jgi:hypothetical protein
VARVVAEFAAEHPKHRAKVHVVRWKEPGETLTGFDQVTWKKEPR